MRHCARQCISGQQARGGPMATAVPVKPITRSWREFSAAPTTVAIGSSLGIADQVDVRGMVVRPVAFERRQVVVRVADLVTGPASETLHIKRLMRRGNPRLFDYLIGEEAYGGRYF